MRIGQNPEKSKQNQNVLKKHRIIVVFYIPDSQNNYFEDLDLVLNKCLETLFLSINEQTTAVTLINNNSSNSIDKVVDRYKNRIDKYVIYNDNKGKVYAIINEVKGVFEEFVTISDADVLFFDGWENAVFEIFKKVPKAGVVSPLPVPHCTFTYNNSVFFNTFINKIKYVNLLNKSDTELFKSSIDNDVAFRRKNNVYWDEKQLYLKKNKELFLLGSTHFVATYRKFIFDEINSFPKHKFKPGYENEFIDFLADKNGLYRLSAKKTYAYHIGNKLDEMTNNYFSEGNNTISNDFFNTIPKTLKQNKILIYIKSILGRIAIKFIWDK